MDVFVEKEIELTNPKKRTNKEMLEAFEKMENPCAIICKNGVVLMSRPKSRLFGALGPHFFEREKKQIRKSFLCEQTWGALRNK